MSARTIQVLTSQTAFTELNRHPDVFMHFRYMHIKHHSGRKHKSQATRSNKRKAARKAKNRR